MDYKRSKMLNSNKGSINELLEVLHPSGYTSLWPNEQRFSPLLLEHGEKDLQVFTLSFFFMKNSMLFAEMFFTFILFESSFIVSTGLGSRSFLINSDCQWFKVKREYKTCKLRSG